ncbi:DUF2007 domain-containing protein [Zunongwangia sp.]|uniref:putative signal transducing protein n=1 Tax=Zunongwangia sp. TaxID=1965325 RepID=UPI003AA9B4EA
MNSSLKVIASFQYASEAQIVKARLEAEEIQVVINNEHTINTDPLISNAIGGVELMVFDEDEARAKTILESISKYSLDNAGEPIHCPNCNSSKIEYYTSITDFKSFIYFFVGFLFSVLPMYTKYSYRCENCKYKFNLK